MTLQTTQRTLYLLHFSCEKHHCVVNVKTQKLNKNYNFAEMSYLCAALLCGLIIYSIVAEEFLLKQ